MLLLAAAAVLVAAKPTSASTFVCEDDYDCYPNGTCGPELSCRCNPGFFGERCEDPCPIQCQNGGQCVMADDHGGLIEANHFYCDCPPGHTGGLCEDPIPFLCEDDYDCLPNGTCGPQLTCVCKPGYYGEQCDGPCPIQCQNGGQCVMEDDHGGLVEASEFYCDCPPEFEGGLCQKKKKGQGGDATELSSKSDPAQNGGHTIGIVFGVVLGVGLFVVVVAWSGLRLRRRARNKNRGAPGDQENPEEIVVPGPEDMELPPVE